MEVVSAVVVRLRTLFDEGLSVRMTIFLFDRYFIHHRHHHHFVIIIFFLPLTYLYIESLALALALALRPKSLAFIKALAL